MATADTLPHQRSWRGVPPEVRRAERRELLVDAAYELLGAEGWNGTTVRGVCQSARLNPRYFYESFDSLESLFIAVFDRLVQEATRAALEAIDVTTAGDRHVIRRFAVGPDEQVVGLGVRLVTVDVDRVVQQIVLVSRLRAVVRQGPVDEIVYHADESDVVVDGARRRAFRGGRELELAPKEFGVLELLMSCQGRCVSAEELLARVWDEAADPFTATVKITISRLRAKLGDPPVIETVAKSGYRI